MSQPSAPVPSLPLVDTHAHLADPRLHAQLEDVLARAATGGVGRVLAVGTTAIDSGTCVEMAGRFPVVSAAVGIHPNHLAESAPGDWGRVEELAGRPGVVAIGETGLDRHWDDTPFDRQQDGFDRHLALARRLDLPVVIHCRECEADIVAQLERFGPPIRGVLHSFTGDWDAAQAFLKLGLHLSFAGMLTFANKSLDALREAAARAPLARLLVETDSPYLSPHPFRGKPNEPARVVWTAARLADLRGISLDDLARTTSANAQSLFRWPDQR